MHYQNREALRKGINLQSEFQEHAIYIVYLEKRNSPNSPIQNGDREWGVSLKTEE